MLSISVPNRTNTVSRVSLGGITYSFHFIFNSVTQRHYLNIYYGSNLIVAGLKLLEGVRIIDKYSLESFSGGELVVVKTNQTDDDVGRDNLGIGKAYELLYISPNELR